jgi:biotin carboxyl carrier protein
MNKFTLGIIGKNFDVELERDKIKGFLVSVNGKNYEAQIEDINDSKIHVAVSGYLYLIEIQDDPTSNELKAMVNEKERLVKSHDLLGSKEISFSKESLSKISQDDITVESPQSHVKASGISEGILAPMPGKVVMVNKKVGDDVKVGDVVVILEAMKMENEITSDKDGKITQVRVIEGDSVDAHDVLVVVG